MKKILWWGTASLLVYVGVGALLHWVIFAEPRHQAEAIPKESAFHVERGPRVPHSIPPGCVFPCISMRVSFAMDPNRILISRSRHISNHVRIPARKSQCQDRSVSHPAEQK